MSADQPIIIKNWRYYAGMFFFSLTFILPLFALFIPRMDLDPSMNATLIGICVAGGPEVALILAAAIWGKETLDHFKQKVFSFFGRFFKSLKPDHEVSKFWYYFWLVIWIGTAVPAFLNAYDDELMPFEPHSIERLYFFITFDVLFILSFFGMGAQFWEKLGAIFRYDPPSDD